MRFCKHSARRRGLLSPAAVIFCLLTILFNPLYAMSSTPPGQQDSLLKGIKLPAGFRIHYFAKRVRNARSMALGNKGTVFVGSRSAGNVYALLDSNRDGRADRKIKVASGLNMPNGIAFYQGDLYVAEIHRILRFRKIESHLHKKNVKLPEPEVFFTNLPDETHHGWRYLRIGKDRKLYIGIGAPCNICNETGFAQIRRIDLKTKKVEIVARGVRNTVGFDFNPVSGKFWFSDNGRDFLGDDSPPDEINRVDRTGEHFGYPFCHGRAIRDPKYGKPDSCRKYKKPVVRLGAHVAPLGIRFYTGKMFPANYHNQLFVAEHGSWNRSSKAGYKIQLITLNNDKVTGVKVFASGWLKGESTLGRPVDFLVLKDGSLLISDDYRSVIYRVTYNR